jgi:hypothetical protein
MKEIRLFIGLRPILLSILLSILFLALGFLAIWLTKNVLKIEQAVVLACVAIIPILVYLIFSGRLSKVSFPGGPSIKLFEALQRPLSSQDKFNMKQVEAEAADVIEKKAVEFLVTRSLDEYARYIVLTVTLERPLPYDTPAIVKYLRVLSQYRNCKFLVILDQSNKVFAYTSIWKILLILEKEVKIRRDDFAEHINKGLKQGLVHRYNLIDQWVSVSDKKMAALEKMTHLKTDALMVVDEHNVLIGVVEREQILSELLLDIAQSET